MNKLFQKFHHILYLIIIFLLLFKINIEKKSNYNPIKSEIENIKLQSEEIIKKKEKEINYLTFKNIQSDLKIKEKEKVIDSLNLVKKKTEMMFLYRIKQINDFNSKQLENYWKNELK
jgi:hypothetical protein